MNNAKGHFCSGKGAVVLLSGGLDSAVTLYLAKKQGFECFCLIFDYGQRHKKEIESAKRIAQRADCTWQIIKINLPWKGSALLDRNIIIPKWANGSTGSPSLEPSRARSRDGQMVRQAHHPLNHPERGRRTGKLANDIPITYVPARNIIFLSFALSYAESIGAGAIFIGAHCQDYSGYPDCRPEFFRAFAKVISKGTKVGAEGKAIKAFTPLINKTKAEIIRLGVRLRVPFQLSWSCYRGGRYPCGECDSCYFRAKGFLEAGIEDPL
jgi:7-cyano-7-deazaguanine synthase